MPRRPNKLAGDLTETLIKRNDLRQGIALGQPVSQPVGTTAHAPAGKRPGCNGLRTRSAERLAESRARLVTRAPLARCAPCSAQPSSAANVCTIATGVAAIGISEMGIAQVEHTVTPRPAYLMAYLNSPFLPALSLMRSTAASLGHAGRERPRRFQAAA